MPILGIIQWVGYFHVFRAPLGVFELIIMGDRDCCDLYSKVSCFTISMCLRNVESNILRVWFKLKKVSFSVFIFNINFVFQMSADKVKFTTC